MEIKRHKITSFLDEKSRVEQCSYFINSLESETFEFFENDSSQVASDVKYCLEELNAYLIINRVLRNVSTKLLCYLRVLATAKYLLAYGEGLVKVRYRKEPVMLEAIPFKNDVTLNDWLDARSIFYILKDQNGLGILEGITESSMERWNKLDRNILSFFGSLNSAGESFKIIESFLIRAIESTHVTSGDYLCHEPEAVDYVMSTYEPLLFLYHQVLLRDQEGFDKELVKSLERHKEYYGTTKDRRNNSEYGFISWKILGACAMACDAGLVVNVKSEYIPEWVYRREFDMSSVPNWVPLGSMSEWYYKDKYKR